MFIYQNSGILTSSGRQGKNKLLGVSDSKWRHFHETIRLPNFDLIGKADDVKAVTRSQVPQNGEQSIFSLRKKNDNKQTECWMNNVMVELCSLYCDSRAAVVRNKTHMPSISQRPALWPVHTHSTHEAIPGGWCQQFRKLVSKCVVNYLWCQKLCLSINILETFYSLTLVIHLSEYPVGFKWFPYGIVMFFLSQYTVTM